MKSAELVKMQLITTPIIMLFIASVLAGCSQSVEDELQKEIEQLSIGGRLSTSISQLDFICFAETTVPPKDAFVPPAARIGQDFSRHEYELGDGCHATDSEVGGRVGLVRGSRVQCIGIRKFRFLVQAPGDALCAKPSKIKVTREAATTPIRRSGVCCEIPAGSHYYAITTQEP